LREILRKSSLESSNLRQRLQTTSKKYKKRNIEFVISQMKIEDNIDKEINVKFKRKIRVKEANKENVDE